MICNKMRIFNAKKNQAMEEKSQLNLFEGNENTQKKEWRNIPKRY